MGNDNGQLILISGFLIAIGLVVITIMLNNVIFAGNIAYVGTMDTPGNDLLYLQDLTNKECNSAYVDANRSGVFDNNVYSRYMNNYSNAITKLYAYKGSSVRISDMTVDVPNKKANLKVIFTNNVIDSKYTATINIQPTPLPVINPPPDPSGTPTRLEIHANKQEDVINGPQPPILTIWLMDNSGHSIPQSGVPITITSTLGTPSAGSIMTDLDGKAEVTLICDTPGISSVTASSAGLLSSTIQITFTPPPPPEPITDPVLHNMEVSLSPVERINDSAVRLVATIKNTGGTRLDNVGASLLVNSSDKQYTITLDPTSVTLPTTLMTTGDSATVKWTVCNMKKNKEYKFQVLSSAICSNDKNQFCVFSDFQYWS